MGTIVLKQTWKNVNQSFICVDYSCLSSCINHFEVPVWHRYITLKVHPFVFLHSSTVIVYVIQCQISPNFVPFFFFRYSALTSVLLCVWLCVVPPCWKPPCLCDRLWPQVPHQPFHPDNKEPPAARTGGLLNEISYQSANSCGLCLAIRSGYESPSAALNSYHLDVYLLGGKTDRLPLLLCSKQLQSLVCGCQGTDTSHYEK